MTTDDATEPLARIRTRLIDRAHVFDDPVSYRAGVDDTIAALASLGVADQSDQPSASRGDELARQLWAARR